MRWSEEVDLLQEEMRRTQEYFSWHADSWEKHARSPSSDLDDVTEGMRAYAHRQASIRRKMRDYCRTAWRYVGAWVCLGQGTSDESGTATSLTSDSIPSLASSFADSTESIQAVLEANMRDVLDDEMASEDFD